MSSDSIHGENTAEDNVPSSITRRLYISHFLSTWNSRVFEFGAVLYLASIFPGTLLPISLYALTRGASAIALSPAVGRYIDTHNRLHVVRFSIGTLHASNSLPYLTDASSLPATGCCYFLHCALAHGHGIYGRSGIQAMVVGSSCIVGVR